MKKRGSKILLHRPFKVVPVPVTPHPSKTWELVKRTSIKTSLPVSFPSYRNCLIPLQMQYSGVCINQNKIGRLSQSLIWRKLQTAPILINISKISLANSKNLHPVKKFTASKNLTGRYLAQQILAASITRYLLVLLCYFWKSLLRPHPDPFQDAVECRLGLVDWHNSSLLASDCCSACVSCN
jgi:hypothetical protein